MWCLTHRSTNIPLVFVAMFLQPCCKTFKVPFVLSLHVQCDFDKFIFEAPEAEGWAKATHVTQKRCRADSRRHVFMTCTCPMEGIRVLSSSYAICEFVFCPLHMPFVLCKCVGVYSGEVPIQLALAHHMIKPLLFTNLIRSIESIATATVKNYRSIRSRMT